MSIAVHQGCQEWLFRILTAQGCPADKGCLLSADDTLYLGLHLLGARDTFS